MKQRSIACFLVLIGTLFCLSAAMATGSQSPAQPKAVAPEPRFDFPAVVEGTEVTHDFVLENHGTAPLNITKVQTG